MRICRKLFVVLLGNNHHGKSTAITALVSQGLGAPRRSRKGNIALPVRLAGKSTAISLVARTRKRRNLYTTRCERH